MICGVPEAIADIEPVAASIVASDRSPLLQVPPPPSDNVIFSPSHTGVRPVIALGGIFTVIG